MKPAMQPARAPNQASASIARQPILNVEQEVVAYKLFFDENRDERRPENEIARSAIETALIVGLDALCAGSPGFIQFTEAMLLQGYPKLLPADQIVVELGREVPPSEAVLAACRQLHSDQYTLCLADFLPNDSRQALTPFSPFLAVDPKRISPKEAGDLTQRYIRMKHRLIARGMETRQEFSAARACGFTHFQGYYFREPEHLRARQIPGNKAIYLRLLQAVATSQVNLHDIASLIKQEASLCYRLLRYLNSPAFGIATPVQSIQHALTLLGERQTIRWIRMATAMVIADDKPSDLVLCSLVRARFSELIGTRANHGKADLFLVGMLSLMDSILEIPIGVLMEGIAIDSDTRNLILDGKMGRKTELSPIFELIVAREAGDWGKVSATARQLNISLVFVAESYNEAMRWAHEVMTGTKTPAAKS